MCKGWPALQRIAGLPRVIGKIFLINYIIFIILILLLNGILYFFLLNPLIDYFFVQEEGGISLVGRIFLWTVQLMIAAIFAILALRISLVLMSIWHENLVAFVIRHFRTLPEQSFTMREWIGNMKRMLLASLRELLLFLLLILLGLLPGIGVILVLAIGAYMMGRGIIAPYINVLEEHKERVAEVQKSLRMSAFLMGASQMLLALIPLVGWLLMPLLTIYQIIGLTYALEEAKASPAIS